ncbi:universal stress protein [Lentzea albida]|uniref:Nucleotide-binding universal stress protein, UspA family n=1 Tax=Lentzea albida TaxID=65499 RepID=A0A1H9RFR9_9PSEU|nr:universal stress protein [Lentzea albida]SER71542.1 Nucleotide-binding universal stress protein, UspA family [Lentzea albida]
MITPIGHTGTVVVGLDGSEAAQRAVRWAASEAARRKSSLRVVHAELPLPPDAPDLSGMARRALHEEALHWTEAAVEAALAVAPGLAVEVRVEVGSALRLLEEESETAALVVVGSRGLGGFAGLLLGSVAVGLSCHSRCPMVVVRGDDLVPDGPVVVGVNGSPENWHVLDRAFEEAGARGAELVAVHAWRPPLGTPGIAESVGIVWSELDVVRGAKVVQRLEACADRHPGVKVSTHVVHGSAAHRLVEFAHGAALLVVGARGTGGLTGMVLGSTSQAVLRHAPCPVLLVRPVLAEQVEHAAR